MEGTQHSVRESWKIFDASLSHLAHGSSTNSKRPRDREAEPAVVVRGKGCRVWDADGNEYIDFRNSLGPVTLGYAVEEINTAVREQLEDGVVYGHPHPLEGQVAELLTEIIPCAERVRFLKTGGEAIAACIKIARNATGRNKVIHCGYNGWLNVLAGPVGYRPEGIASSRPEKGVPQAIRSLHMSLPWGDAEQWRRVIEEEAKDLAAVVIASDYAGIEQGRTFLPAVREMTSRHGVMMIMDEIVTGFRLALAGAQEFFGIEPDLAVFGKGLANGMPLSAYLGRAELMDSAAQIGISSTFGGDALSLAAARAAIGMYLERDVIGHLWRVGSRLQEGLNGILDEAGIRGKLLGAPVCGPLSFEPAADEARFISAGYREGVSLYHVPYVNFSHSAADIDEALEAIERAAESMQG